MLKIIELRNTIADTTIVNNIYEINAIIKKMINQTEFMTDLKHNDFNYINIALEQAKINLTKIYYLMQFENDKNNKSNNKNI